MAIAEAYQLRFGEMLVQMPSWWVDALLVWLALIGLVLWLLGRRLAKPLIGLLLAAIGAGGAYFVGRGLIAEPSPTPWIIGGAVVGGLVGLLVWRVAIAVALAVIVAAGLSLTLMLTGPVPEAPLVEPIRKAAVELGETVREATGMAAESEGAVKKAELPSLTEPLNEAKKNIAEAWGGWWNEDLARHQRWWLIGACVGGGVLALLIGLALPGLAASLVMALIGVGLMTGGVGRLAGALPESAAGAIPSTLRSALLAVLVATLIGALLQWTLFRGPPRRPDE